jgi:hypothetical protein
MKTDILGQSILIVSVILFVLTAWRSNLTIVSLGVLCFWQMSSAIELTINYNYRQRQAFVWLLLLLLLLLPLTASLFSPWVLVVISAGLFSYFLLTARDTIKVYRRPRSFWDL